MTNANIKREARNLYNKKELFKAYNCAWQLSFTEFIKWFTDSNGKRRSSKKVSLNSNPFFYQSFLTTQPIQWLNHKEAILLWEYYLSSQKNILLEFELYVAYNNPQVFIEGYKSKNVFFEEQRLAELEKHHLPQAVVNELKIWRKLNSLLNKKWNAVLESIDALDLLPHEILMSICASFESFIYQNPDDKERWHFAVETLSLLVAFFQSKYDFSKVEVSDEHLLVTYFNGAEKLLSELTFKSAYDYVVVRRDIVRYSYEPDLFTFLKEGEIRFCESESFNKQWSYDEHRYTVNEQSYYAFGEELFDSLKENNKIKFVNNNYDNRNQLGNARQMAIFQCLRDLGVMIEDLKNSKLPELNFILSFLHGIAWRKLSTTELPLHKISRSRNNDYFNGILEFFVKHQNSEVILINDKSTLYDATMGTGLNCTIQEFESLVNAFTFKGKKKFFNAVKQKDNLWQKPFIQVGSVVISPISVLTAFTGLYTLSESILKNFVPREGKRIELILNERYKNEIWKTSIPSTDQEYGDVDMVMEDNSHIVLMQLKRTSQKTDMRELYNQKPQDQKANRQLKEAAATFKTEKEIHLWYVTTAFEKVGTRDNGVLRVSYQDLLGIKRLMDSEGKMFKSLSGLIELIETDRLYELGKEHMIK